MGLVDPCNRSWELILAGPLRPLYRSVQPPAGKSSPEEALFISKTDPEQEWTGIFLIYQYPPRTVVTDSRIELVQGGAHFIVARYMKPGTASPDWYPPNSCVKKKKVVLTREKPGRLAEFRKDATERLDGPPRDCAWLFPEMRVVSWREPLLGGNSVYWTIENSPDLYDEGQTLGFIDAMEAHY